MLEVRGRYPATIRAKRNRAAWTLQPKLARQCASRDVRDARGGITTVGIALAPLGQSPEGDRAHAAVAGLGYLALAAMGPSAAPTLAKRRPLLGQASVAVGAVSIACLGLSLVRPEAGLWQRAGLLATDAWLIAMGLRAVTVAGRDEEPE